MGYWTN